MQVLVLNAFPIPQLYKACREDRSYTYKFGCMIRTVMNRLTDTQTYLLKIDRKGQITRLKSKTQNISLKSTEQCLSFFFLFEVKNKNVLSHTTSIYQFTKVGVTNLNMKTQKQHWGHLPEYMSRIYL